MITLCAIRQLQRQLLQWWYHIVYWLKVPMLWGHEWLMSHHFHTRNEKKASCSFHGTGEAVNLDVRILGRINVMNLPTSTREFVSNSGNFFGFQSRDNLFGFVTNFQLAGTPIHSIGYLSSLHFM